MKILIATGYPDKEGEMINLAGMRIDNPIKVLADFDWHQELGIARIWIEDENYLYADIQIHSNIRLHADTYPSIGYQMINKIGNRVEQSNLICIGICNGATLDERIRSLGEQHPGPSFDYISFSAR